MSKKDLNVADLVYDRRFFSQALYHLQQSNEKLVKALLLSIGILTPKKSKRDLEIKSLFGFYPKEPKSYGHRTMKPLIVDLQKFVPTIQELLTLLKDSTINGKMAELERLIKRGKRGMKKLKKKPANLIKNGEQLEREIKAAKSILDKLEKMFCKINQEIDRLDFQEINRVALTIAEKEGLDIKLEHPTFLEIKNEMLRSLKISVLITISGSMAFILDPLVSITRYPDPNSPTFDENNPYVEQFSGLLEVVKSCLEKSDNIFS